MSETGSGVIYIIRSGNFAKVGYSRRLADRLKTIREYNPHQVELLVTFPNQRGLEFALHRYLAAHHVSQEWFLWCDALDALVKDGLPPDWQAFRGLQLGRRKPAGRPRRTDNVVSE